MGDPAAWRETAADRALLRRWQAAGALAGPLSPEDRADPAPAQWRAFLDRFSLWLGVALCAAGVICFIAANWDALGKVERLAGAQALVVLATLAAMRLGVTRIAGQAALWFATIALGALLALIGQTYQTGADTWELFALWTALALPWTLAARNAVQWLTWGFLLNLATGLWLGLHGRWSWFGGLEPLVCQGQLNFALLALWELAGTRWPEFGGRIGRRLLAAAAIAMLSFAAMDDVLGDFHGERVQPFAGLFGVPSLVWAVAMLAITAFHGRVRRDLPVLATVALGIIAVVTTVLVKLLLIEADGDAAAFLLIAATVVVQAAVAAVVLRRLARGEAA